jgi:hypothetical protein
MKLILFILNKMPAFEAGTEGGGTGRGHVPPPFQFLKKKKNIRGKKIL